MSRRRTTHRLHQRKGWTDQVVERFVRGESIATLAPAFGMPMTEIEGLLRRTMQWQEGKFSRPKTSGNPSCEEDRHGSRVVNGSAVRGRSQGGKAMLSVLDVAMLCHEVNRSFCQILGDLTQQPWAQAPAWQQDSAVNGVLHRLEHPEAPASASHESWLVEKVAAGWVYGPMKDPEAKTHPCMRPYAELPIEQRQKDALFCAVVDVMRPLLLATEWNKVEAAETSGKA